MEKFALKVDFSALGKEVLYEKAMTLVDPKWLNVAFLENRLKTNFKISFDIGFKSSDGFYISRDEPVEILRYVDTLIAFKRKELSDEQVIHCEKNKSNPFKTKSDSKPDNGVEIVTTADFISKKKRKQRSFSSFTTSTPATNLAKRLKGLQDEEDSFQKGLRTTDGKEESMQSELSPVSFGLPTKRNKNNSLSQSPNKVSRVVLKEQSKSSSNVENSKQHVFFDESGNKAYSNEKANTEEQPQKIEVVFLCELETSNQKTSRGRLFQINKVQNKEKKMEESDASKQSNIIDNSSNHISVVENITIAKPFNQNNKEHNSHTDITESAEKTSTTVDAFTNESSLKQSTKPSELLESLISCEDSAVIEINESESYLTQNLQSKCSSFSESSMNGTENSSNITDERKAEPLKDLPNIGDHIIFKAYLSNDQISENFIGKCEYTNKRTKIIKFHIIDGYSQIRHLPQKYTGNLDDSDDFKIMNIKLQEMITPKILLTE